LFKIKLVLINAIGVPNFEKEGGIKKALWKRELLIKEIPN